MPHKFLERADELDLGLYETSDICFGRRLAYNVYVKWTTVVNKKRVHST